MICCWTEIMNPEKRPSARESPGPKRKAPAASGPKASRHDA